MAHRGLHRRRAVRHRRAGFVKLAPAPRGFVPSKPSGANPEGSLAHRLAANLRSPRQLALFAQAFLLMGGFVALYNFLGFRLTGAPFFLPPFAVSLVFLAYLAGTWASSRAGAEATRFGRKRVLLVSIAIMVAGVAITLSDNVIAVLVGLVIATAGFFGAHSIASGWTGSRRPSARRRRRRCTTSSTTAAPASSAGSAAWRSTRTAGPPSPPRSWCWRSSRRPWRRSFLPGDRAPSV